MRKVVKFLPILLALLLLLGTTTVALAQAATATPVAMPTPVTTAAKRKGERGSVSVGRVESTIVRVVVVRVAPISRAMPMPVVPPTTPAAVAVMATVMHRLYIGICLLL